jgi:hypothetical protein
MISAVIQSKTYQLTHDSADHLMIHHIFRDCYTIPASLQEGSTAEGPDMEWLYSNSFFCKSWKDILYQQSNSWESGVLYAGAIVEVKVKASSLIEWINGIKRTSSL